MSPARSGGTEGGKGPPTSPKISPVPHEGLCPVPSPLKLLGPPVTLPRPEGVGCLVLLVSAVAIALNSLTIMCCTECIMPRRFMLQRSCLGDFRRGVLRAAVGARGKGLFCLEMGKGCRHGCRVHTGAPFDGFNAVIRVCPPSRPTFAVAAVKSSLGFASTFAGWGWGRGFFLLVGRRTAHARRATPARSFGGPCFGSRAPKHETKLIEGKRLLEVYFNLKK